MTTITPASRCPSDDGQRGPRYLRIVQIVPASLLCPCPDAHLPVCTGCVIDSHAAINDPHFCLCFMKATACLESGHLGEAVTVFKKLQASFDEMRAGDPLDDARVHYMLGIAYQQSGWLAEAGSEFQTFLNHWKDADPGIREIDDAKARLANLRT